MPSAAPGLVAYTFAILVPAMWGLYWLPLRALDAVATAGPWATASATTLGAVSMAPFAWRARRALLRSDPRALLAMATGGVSFVVYSNGLLYGHVAVVILLFYLTPIWSMLIGRVFLGWHASWWRYAALVIGVGGIALVLKGGHGGLPLPTSLGDWFGLLSGLLWSISSTGIRTSVTTDALATNFVFVGGGAVGAILIAFGLTGLPPIPPMPAMPGTAFWTAVLGLVWWGASLAVFMWVARIMDPTRLGILMMAEAITGTVSAALLTDEPFGWLMAIGGGLVLLAGYLESRHEPPVVEAHA